MMTRCATMFLLTCAALFQPAPVLAEQAMSGGEFEAYTTGKTLTYGTTGEPYGIEQYLPGRRVLWAFVGQECRDGTWYEAGSQICFVYDGLTDGPQCWTFFRDPGGLRARFEDGTASSELVEVEQTPAPMDCPGPDLGV